MTTTSSSDTGVAVGPDRQRILHVVNRVQERGDGIANVCVDLACQQAKSGSTVGLACEPGGFVSLAEAHGVQHFEISMSTRAPSALISAYRALRLTYRAFRPDVVHTHTLTATVMARLAALGSPVKVLATVHNEYQRGVSLMRLAHCVVGVSLAVSKAMVARRISRRRVRTVHNGTIGSARRMPVADVPVPQLARLPIVAIGAVSHRKGADLLLAAFFQIADVHPDCELYFVGNLDWPVIAEQANSSPHRSRVHFEGFRPQPQAYLGPSTIFVLPSRRDPFPLVLLEALEAGVPIVAARVDGIPEALGSGAAGLLVEPDSVPALAEALRALLSDPMQRSELSEAARIQSAKFSVQKMTQDYDSIYGELVAGRLIRPADG